MQASQLWVSNKGMRTTGWRAHVWGLCMKTSCVALVTMALAPGRTWHCLALAELQGMRVR